MSIIKCMPFENKLLLLLLLLLLEYPPPPVLLLPLLLMPLLHHQFTFRSLHGLKTTQSRLHFYLSQIIYELGPCLLGHLVVMCVFSLCMVLPMRTQCFMVNPAALSCKILPTHATLKWLLAKMHIHVTIQI